MLLLVAPGVRGLVMAGPGTYEGKPQQLAPDPIKPDRGHVATPAERGTSTRRRPHSHQRRDNVRQSCMRERGGEGEPRLRRSLKERPSAHPWLCHPGWNVGSCMPVTGEVR